MNNANAISNDNVFLESYLQFYIANKERKAETPVSALSEKDLLSKATNAYDVLINTLKDAIRNDYGYSSPETDDANARFSLPKDDRINSVLDALCQYATRFFSTWKATDLSDLLREKVCSGSIPCSFGGLEPACAALAIATTFGELETADIVFLHGKWETRGDSAYNSHVVIRCINHTAMVFTEANGNNAKEQFLKDVDNAYSYDFSHRSVCEWMNRYRDSLTASPKINVANSKFVFAGFGRNDEKNHCLVKAVIDRGGILHDSVSEATDYLVVNPRYADEEKMQKALEEKEKGHSISIILIDDLMDYLVDTAFISANAYKNRADLTEFTIPYGVINIGKSAFSECKNLTSITIPDSVVTINAYAFYKCEKLTAVTIPNSVKRIEDCAFQDCSNINSLVLPTSCETNGSQIFDGCTAVKNLHIPASFGFYSNWFPSLETVTIDENDPNLHCVNNCLITNKSAKLWLGCKNSVIPTDKDVQIIGECAFKRRVGPETLIIPQNIKKITYYAFCECVGLKTVIIENGIEDIGFSAFEECESLTHVTISSNKLKTIAERTFCGCQSLETVEISGKVSSIEKEAFLNCKNLKHVTLPDGLTSIGPDAFSYCTSLQSIHIPASVKRISKNAFVNCKNLTEIINDSVVPVEVKITTKK